MARAAAKQLGATVLPSTPKGVSRRRAPKGPPPGDPRPWGLWAAAAILAVLALRLGINALNLVPVHFDEAQYWAYGQELDWGYFSKPPLVGLVIRVATDLLGDTGFALRLASPLCHAGIAALIYATGRRLWGGRTGFWAAVGYTAAPGVGVSAMLMSTDPVMMLGWAAALYATVRGIEDGSRGWWLAAGVALGLGVMAKYTALVFVLGLLAHLATRPREVPLDPGAPGSAASTAPRRRPRSDAAARPQPIPAARLWTGAGVALLATLAVVAPNLFWNATNGFVTFAHVAEDAAPTAPSLSPLGLAEFLGAQAGVIGPVFLGAMALAAWGWRGARHDPGLRLMLWQSVPLVLGMAALALITRAQPNWAAPAYVAGSLAAARVLVARGSARALQAQIGLGASAMVCVLALALAYAGAGAEALPRALDPFKKMRIGAPFCERALAAMGEEGAVALLSTDRRRLSECMFAGGLGWDEVAVWNPELIPRNHAEFVATLRPGDARPLLLAVPAGAAEIAARFDSAREIESGRFATHADREISYELWLVEGFTDYGIAY